MTRLPNDLSSDQDNGIDDHRPLRELHSEDSDDELSMIDYDETSLAEHVHEVSPAPDVANVFYLEDKCESSNELINVQQDSEGLSRFTQCHFQNEHDDSAMENIFEEEQDYWNEVEHFRTGRINKGLSYNVLTGELMRDEHETLEKDSLPPAVDCSDVSNHDDNFSSISTHTSKKAFSFDMIYRANLPPLFTFGNALPQVEEMWVLKYAHEDLKEIVTFELQAAICAALNSRHYMLLLIGVNEQDEVTGCELSARDRVCFRMAVSRAVAGEFQPPLINASPATLHGIERVQDVASTTSAVDVVFIPVVTSVEEPLDCRYLIAVRVKERTNKYYQLSSGRIYVEEDGQVVEMSCVDEAVRNLMKADENPMLNKFKQVGKQLELQNADRKESPNSQRGNPVKAIPWTEVDGYDWLESSMYAVCAVSAIFGGYKLVKTLIQ